MDLANFFRTKVFVELFTKIIGQLNEFIVWQKCQHSFLFCKIILFDFEPFFFALKSSKVKCQAFFVNVLWNRSLKTKINTNKYVESVVFKLKSQNCKTFYFSTFRLFDSNIHWKKTKKNKIFQAKQEKKNIEKKIQIEQFF